MLVFILIIIGLFAFIFIYNKLTNFMVNPYNLVCYFGKKGVGKSSLISCLRYELRNDFDYFYCTDNVVGTNWVDISKLGEFVPKPNSVLFIDEIGLVFNNRDYKSFDKTKIEFFKLQRHYKCKVICFSQVFDDSDKVIRNLFDEIHILTRVARIFQMDRTINRKFDIFNYSSGNEEQSTKGGAIIDVYKYKGLPKFRYLPRWINYHDSFSINANVKYYPIDQDIQDVYYPTAFNFYTQPIQKLYKTIKSKLTTFFEKFNSKLD